MKTTQVWLDASVHTVREITPTVREFTLRPSDGVRPHEPGSHLQVQINVGQGALARPQTRSYSLIGPSDGAFYRIAVKRLDEGRGGSLAMWRLSVGDRLRISEPQNHFSLDLVAPAYLLVAGGIGITPLVLMAQTLARRGVMVRMVYGARTQDELAYLPDLTALQSPFSLQTAVSSLDQSIDFDAEIAALPPGTQAYVCGPVPMLDAMRRAWQSAGRPLADLRYETFGSSGRFAPQAFRVKIPRQAVDITVPANCSLLDALELQGVQALCDCRRGECGLCAMDVLSVDGEIDHRDVFLSDEEKAQNRRICVCVSRAVGSITLDSAYRPEI